MDKAQKYTDKAIAQIEKLRNSYDSKPLLLSSFQVLLMEHIVQCRLVTGNKGGAIQEIGNMCRLLQSNQILLQRHRAQLHTMLGLYAMSMNCMEAAENQFNAALRVRTILRNRVTFIIFIIHWNIFPEGLILVQNLEIGK
jgi:MAternally-affected-uncoordination protein